MLQLGLGKTHSRFDTSLAPDAANGKAEMNCHTRAVRIFLILLCASGRAQS